MRNWKIMDLRQPIPRVKVLNPKPTDTPSKVPTAIQTYGYNPNDTPITVPTTIPISVVKKGV